MPRKPTNTSDASAPTDAPIELEVVAGTKGVDGEPPSDLQPTFAEFWRQLHITVRTIFGAVGPHQRRLIVSAARSAQAEEEARQFAAEAAILGDAKDYQAFSAIARSEGRAMRSALGALCLTGERANASSQTNLRKAELATAPGTGRWTKPKSSRWKT